MNGDSCEIERLRGCSDQDEQRDLLGKLFDDHVDKLRLAVKLRLSPQLGRRVSVSDVLQEAYIDAQQRLKEYLSGPGLPFHLWLRFLTLQRLKTLYRHHFRAQVRDMGREVPLRGDSGSWDGKGAPPVAAKTSPPSDLTMRHERENRFRQALNQLSESDREVVVLRNFEQLSYAEAAAVLGVPEPTIRQRHSRALKRLKENLRSIVRDRSGFWK